MTSLKENSTTQLHYLTTNKIFGVILYVETKQIIVGRSRILLKKSYRVLDHRSYIVSDGLQNEAIL